MQLALEIYSYGYYSEGYFEDKFETTQDALEFYRPKSLTPHKNYFVTKKISFWIVLFKFKEISYVNSADIFFRIIEKLL